MFWVTSSSSSSSSLLSCWTTASAADRKGMQGIWSYRHLYLFSRAVVYYVKLGCQSRGPPKKISTKTFWIPSRDLICWCFVNFSNHFLDSLFSLKQIFTPNIAWSYFVLFNDILWYSYSLNRALTVIRFIWRNLLLIGCLNAGWALTHYHDHHYTVQES